MLPRPVSLANAITFSGPFGSESFGPTIDFILVRQGAQVTLEFTFAATLTLNLPKPSPSLPAPSIPSMQLSGILRSHGVSTLLARTDPWTPVRNFGFDGSALTIPALNGSVQFLQDGTVSGNVTHLDPFNLPALPKCSACGDIVQLTGWRFSLGVHKAAPAGPVQMWLVATGTIRLVLMNDLVLDVTYSIVDTSAKAFYATIRHTGGWKPFPDLSFVSPPLDGIADIRTVEQSISLTVSTTLQSQLQLVPSLLTITGTSGSGGPTFTVTYFQQRAQQLITTSFIGRVCVKLDPSLSQKCLSVIAIGIVSPAPFRFIGVRVTGNYTGGDIYPLDAALPGNTLIIVRANVNQPLQLTIEGVPTNPSEMGFDYEAKVTLDLSAFAAGLSSYTVTLKGRGLLLDGMPKGVFSALMPPVVLPEPLGTLSGMTLVLCTAVTADLSLPAAPGAIPTLRQRYLPSTMPLTTTLSIGPVQGISIYWQGKLPDELKMFCSGTVILRLSIPLDSTLDAGASCSAFSLIMLCAKSAAANGLCVHQNLPPPNSNIAFELPTIEYLEFTAMAVYVRMARGPPSTFFFGLKANFKLATTSRNPQGSCTSMGALCLIGSIDARLGITPGQVHIAFAFRSTGAWLEPLGLQDFAVVDPNLGLDITFATPCPVGLCPQDIRQVYWSIDIYYKRGGDAQAWPAAMLTRSSWPPVISVDQPQDFMRKMTSRFLYERWHLGLSDSLLLALKMPRFAMVLDIPRLTLNDCLAMLKSVTSSMVAAADPSKGASAPSLASLKAIESFFNFDFKVYMELSLVDGSLGLPEWNNAVIHRGLNLNMTCSATFLSFAFDIRLEALLRLPSPLSLAVLNAFFSAPTAFMQGDLAGLAGITSVQAGLQIAGWTTLPFGLGSAAFDGNITTSTFVMEAEVTLSVVFSITARLLIDSDAAGVTLSAQTALPTLGHLAFSGSVSMSHFEMKASIATGIAGFGWCGQISVGLSTANPGASTLALALRTKLGLLGHFDATGTISPSCFSVTATAQLGSSKVKLNASYFPAPSFLHLTDHLASLGLFSVTDR